MIMQFERDLHQAKLNYEIEIMDMKRVNLQKLHGLELRAATAKAELAELELEQAKKKCNIETE